MKKPAVTLGRGGKDWGDEPWICGRKMDGSTSSTNPVAAGAPMRPAADPPPAAHLHATFLIAGLCCSTLMTARLVLPSMALEQGAGAALTGLLAALFTLAPMLLNLRFGRWADRVGTLRPAMVSAGLIAGASIPGLLRPGLAQLLLAAGLIGAGTMFAHAVATRAVAQSSPTEAARARNLGTMLLFYALFQFLGPIAGAVALEQGGARPALAVTCLPGALALLLLGRGRHVFRGPAGATRAMPRRRGDLVMLPDLRRWLVTGSMFGAVLTVYPFVVSVHAAMIGLSTTQASLVLGACSAGTIVARLCVAPVVRLVRLPLALAAALMLGALVYALLPAMTGLGLFLAGSAVLGLSLGMGVPIALSLLMGTTPEGRANETMGLSMTLTNFIQTLLPLLLGTTGEHLGVAGMVWAMAAGMAACAVLAARGR